MATKLIKTPYKLTIRESTGHGKAVKGTKKTSTIQVREEYGGGAYMLVKQFRFKVGDRASRAKALEKAECFVTDMANL